MIKLYDKQPYVQIGSLYVPYKDILNINFSSILSSKELLEIEKQNIIILINFIFSSEINCKNLYYYPQEENIAKFLFLNTSNKKGKLNKFYLIMNKFNDEIINHCDYRYKKKKKPNDIVLFLYIISPSLFKWYEIPSNKKHKRLIFPTADQEIKKYASSNLFLLDKKQLDIIMERYSILFDNINNVDDLLNSLNDYLYFFNNFLDFNMDYIFLKENKEKFMSYLEFKHYKKDNNEEDDDGPNEEYDKDTFQLFGYLELNKKDNLIYIYLHAFSFYCYYKNNNENCIINYINEYLNRFPSLDKSSLIYKNSYILGMWFSLIQSLNKGEYISIFNITDLHVLNTYTNYYKWIKDNLDSK